jgi:hypothetical protein
MHKFFQDLAALFVAGAAAPFVVALFYVLAIGFLFLLLSRPGTLLLVIIGAILWAMTERAK